LEALQDSFLELAHNKRPIESFVKPEDWCEIYLTRESIIENFASLFRYENGSLAVRFYNFLADGYNMKQIYLPLYLVKLYGLIMGG
jgi:hypothetical protein